MGEARKLTHHTTLYAEGSSDCGEDGDDELDDLLPGRGIDFHIEHEFNELDEYF